MASWDVDELESQLLFREEDKDGIETEIRRITGNRNIELLENERKDGLVAGRLEADGERWPCGDVGPMDMRGMVRIASLFEERSVLGFCDSYSDFYRLETRAASGGGTRRTASFFRTSSAASCFGCWKGCRRSCPRRPRRSPPGRFFSLKAWIDLGVYGKICPWGSKRTYRPPSRSPA